VSSRAEPDGSNDTADSSSGTSLQKEKAALEARLSGTFATHEVSRISYFG